VNLYSSYRLRKTLMHLWGGGLSGLIHKKRTLVCFNLSNHPLKALIVGAFTVCDPEHSNAVPLCVRRSIFYLYLTHPVFSGCSDRVSPSTLNN